MIKNDDLTGDEMNLNKGCIEMRNGATIRRHVFIDEP